MTPIYDQLLWEHVDREDTTFETYHGTFETKTELSGSCTRSEILHTISIRQKEAVSCSKPISILISKTPLPDSETARSSGAGSAPVNPESPRPITSKKKRRGTSSSSPQPRSEIPLSGKGSLSDMGLAKAQPHPRKVFSRSIPGITSPSIRNSTERSSSSTSSALLGPANGLRASFVSLEEITGFSSVRLPEIRGLIISRSSSQMDSLTTKPNSSKNT